MALYRNLGFTVHTIIFFLLLTNNAYRDGVRFLANKFQLIPFYLQILPIVECLMYEHPQFRLLCCSNLYFLHS